MKISIPGSSLASSSALVLLVTLTSISSLSTKFMPLSLLTEELNEISLIRHLKFPHDWKVHFRSLTIPILHLQQLLPILYFAFFLDKRSICNNNYSTQQTIRYWDAMPASVSPLRQRTRRFRNPTAH